MMKITLLLIYLSHLLHKVYVTHVHNDVYKTVEVSDGLLRGRQVTSEAGGSYWSFKAIPYAKPPLGELRFKDAEPPEPWFGVRDALDEFSICPQFSPFLNKFVGIEDCLYTNVYTPKLPCEGARKMPVMIFIHPGGFVYNSATSIIYAPDYIVHEKVVLVTFNYRLNVFGFLCLAEAIPGNAGMKDQVLAMRWVQRNIAAFGGDPRKVTIFGSSSGGASVILHLLSPITKGLFRAAIAQSGTAINPWAQQQNPQESSLRLARAVGCAREDPFAIAHCLRHVDALTLVQASYESAPTERDQKRLIRFSWVPTPEFAVDGVETYLSEPFMPLIKEGRFRKVPLMTGVNTEEGYLIFTNRSRDYTDPAFLEELDRSWELRITPEFRKPISKTFEEEALEAVRKFYLKGKPLTNSTFPLYLDLLSDLSFREGILYSISKMVKFSKAPIYLYLFSADDALNILKWVYNIHRPGAAHADELGYLFNSLLLPHVPKDSTPDIIRRRMVRMWTNFAKTGNPTPHRDRLLDEVKWRPYTERRKNFLQIDAHLRPGVNLLGRKMAFWRWFYRKYSL